MRIGIDIDNTITDIQEDLNNAACKYANSLNKKINLKNLELIDEKNDGNIYQKAFHFTYEELKYFLKNIQENITNNAIPREGVLEFVNKLHLEGYEIYIITARDLKFHDDPYKQSKEWLKKNNIYYDKLIVNARNKGKVCKEEKVDLLIDDNINNCLDVRKYGIKAICLNTNNCGEYKIPIFDNWTDIYNYIKKTRNSKMKNYVRVMDGLKSNANGFEYKLDKVNVSKKWNPSTLNPKEMGGFNFSTEDKILRWIHRGTMIYDVIIPEDAEVVLCDEEKGIYRANKIIVTNPRNITDDVVMNLYRKTNLSNKIIAQCLLTLLFKNRLEIVKFIIKDRVNMNNIDEIVTEFENYASNGNFKYDELECFKTVHDILKEIQSDLYINLYIDKKPYIKKITDDNVINITGESGSGKSYYSNKYLNDEKYIVIDTDVVFSNKPSDNKEILDLRKLFKDESKDILVTDFDKCYLKILNYFKESEKTIVIDSAQYRNIKNYNILKGEVIVIRTCIDNCYNRCLDRYDLENKNATLENKEKFANKKLGMYEWYKSLNNFIEQVDKF